jgi:hypothetical protein
MPQMHRFSSRARSAHPGPPKESSFFIAGNLLDSQSKNHPVLEILQSSAVVLRSELPCISSAAPPLRSAGLIRSDAPYRL